MKRATLAVVARLARERSVKPFNHQVGSNPTGGTNASMAAGDAPVGGRRGIGPNHEFPPMLTLASHVDDETSPPRRADGKTGSRAWGLSDYHRPSRAADFRYGSPSAAMGAVEGRQSAYTSERKQSRDNRGRGLEPHKGAASRTASTLVMTGADPGNGAADFTGQTHKVQDGEQGGSVTLLHTLPAAGSRPAWLAISHRPRRAAFFQVRNQA